MAPLVLTTERADVLLRQLVRTDAPVLFETYTRNRDHLRWWVSNQDLTSEAACRQFITEKNYHLQLGIWYDRNLIWMIEVWAERANYHAGMGFWLARQHCGVGMMSALLPRVITYAFEQIEYFHIGAIVRKENDPSVRLMTGLGFKRRDAVDWINFGIWSKDWNPP